MLITFATRGNDTQYRAPYMSLPAPLAWLGVIAGFGLRYSASLPFEPLHDDHFDGFMAGELI